MRAKFIAAALLVASSSCFATLGGQPSVQSDTRTVVTDMRAQVRANALAYTQHQAVSPAGIQVTEYVNDAGVVFAVTWQGPALPNLRDLLGSHFDAYVAQASQAGRTSRVEVNQSDVVISSTGHMRAFSGRAWVPSLAPAGFTADELN